MIEFDCPCGQHLSVPESGAGRAAFCPSCRKSVPIPGGSPEPAPTASEAPAAPPAEPATTDEPAPAPRAKGEVEIIPGENGEASAIKFSCACGKRVSVPLPPPKKVGRCPACDRKLAVPRGVGWGAGLDKVKKDATPPPEPPGTSKPPPRLRQTREAADRVADRLRPGMKRRVLAKRAEAPARLRRLGAFALDAAAVLAVWGLALLAARLGGAEGLGGSVICGLAAAAVFAAANEILFAARAGARTLGKRLLGLEIVDEEGRRVGAFLLVGRAAAKLILAFGAIFVLVDRDRRALHDIVCGTRVIESPP